MNKNIEGTIGIVAAFFVLFSAMFDSMVSLIIAVASLVGLAIYSFVKK